MIYSASYRILYESTRKREKHDNKIVKKKTTWSKYLHRYLDQQSGLVVRIILYFFLHFHYSNIFKL